MFLTFIGSRASITSSGTGHPVRLTSRLKEEKLWIGIIPGMIGCVMPNMTTSAYQKQNEQPTNPLLGKI
jgi:hypothetical protein